LIFLLFSTLGRSLPLQTPPRVPCHRASGALDVLRLRFAFPVSSSPPPPTHHVGSDTSAFPALSFYFCTCRHPLSPIPFLLGDFLHLFIYNDSHALFMSHNGDFGPTTLVLVSVVVSYKLENPPTLLPSLTLSPFPPPPSCYFD